MTILLVSGGRGYTDFAFIHDTLIKLHRYFFFSLLVHGNARGADRLAKRAGQRIGIPVEDRPADWDTHGKQAGPIRNQAMLDEFRPDMVLAFPGDAGTNDMVNRAIVEDVLTMRADFNTIPSVWELHRPRNCQLPRVRFRFGKCA